MNRLKLVLICASIIFLIWLFVIPTITGFNDSYEEKFCKSYGQWNKYAWSTRHQYSDNWDTLKKQEYFKLMNIVQRDSPSVENLLTKVAVQWFTDSAANDVVSGQTMASILVVECEKNHVKIPEEFLR